MGRAIFRALTDGIWPEGLRQHVEQQVDLKEAKQNPSEALEVMRKLNKEQAIRLGR